MLGRFSPVVKGGNTVGKKHLFAFLLLAAAALVVAGMLHPPKVDASEPQHLGAVRPRFVLSPDGQTVAYFCFRDEKYPVRLCISDLEFKSTFYSPDEALVTSAPEWRADSNRIVFGCYHSDNPTAFTPVYRWRMCVSDKAFEAVSYSQAMYYGRLYD